jgi:hypothetical protein
MWMNEYHADFLARDRLADAREKAARRALVESLRRGRVRRALIDGAIGLGRRLLRVTARRRARAPA